jgi:hypothetical protein
MAGHGGQASEELDPGWRAERGYWVRVADKTEFMSFDEGFALLGEEFGHRYPRRWSRATDHVADRAAEHTDLKRWTEAGRDRSPESGPAKEKLEGKSRELTDQSRLAEAQVQADRVLPMCHSPRTDQIQRPAADAGPATR